MVYVVAGREKTRNYYIYFMKDGFVIYFDFSYFNFSEFLFILVRGIKVRMVSP